jgi:hypothetical protein
MSHPTIVATLIEPSGELIAVANLDALVASIRLTSTSTGFHVGSPNHPSWDSEAPVEQFDLLVVTSMPKSADGGDRQAALYLRRPQES